MMMDRDTATPPDEEPEPSIGHQLAARLLACHELYRDFPGLIRSTHVLIAQVTVLNEHRGVKNWVTKLAEDLPMSDRTIRRVMDDFRHHGLAEGMGRNLDLTRLFQWLHQRAGAMAVLG